MKVTAYCLMKLYTVLLSEEMKLSNSGPANKYRLMNGYCFS